MNFDLGLVIEILIGFFLLFILFGAFFPVITDAIATVGLDAIPYKWDANGTATATLDLSGLAIVFVFALLMLLIVPAIHMVRGKWGGKRR